MFKRARVPIEVANGQCGAIQKVVETWIMQDDQSWMTGYDRKHIKVIGIITNLVEMQCVCVFIFGLLILS